MLIVEDEHVARRALTCLLSASGFVPNACASAEEALRKVDGGAHPAVALVDVDLPGMNGLELVRRLEQSQPDMMTVLITAAEGERIDRFRQEHSVYYLPKPLNFTRLMHLLVQ